MAVSTFRTYLMYRETASSGYSILVPITSVPDLGGTPNMIETTTLSDDTQTFIPGIKQLGDGLEFSANYDKADYEKLKALEGQQHDFAVWKGGTGTTVATAVPTGEDGKWNFTGQLTVFTTGGGTDEAFGMTINIAPSTPISYDGSGATSAYLTGLTISGLRLNPPFTSGTITYFTETTDSSNTITASAPTGSTIGIDSDDANIDNNNVATWGAGANTVKISVSNGGATNNYYIIAEKR